jgi:hypothetical protein
MADPPSKDTYRLSLYDEETVKERGRLIMD